MRGNNEEKFTSILRENRFVVVTCILRGNSFKVFTCRLRGTIFEVFTRNYSDVLTWNIDVVFTTNRPTSSLRRNIFLAKLRRISEEICVTTDV